MPELNSVGVELQKRRRLVEAVERGRPCPRGRPSLEEQAHRDAHPEKLRRLEAARRLDRSCR